MMRISLLNSLRGFAARSCRTGPLRGQSNFTFALNLQPNGMFVRRGTAPVMIGGISSIRLNATTPACGEILEQSVGMAASPVPAYKSEEIVDIATTSTVGRWAEDAAQYTQDVQSMGELAAGGLAGYSPVGLLQQVFEFLHVSAGLPWWGAIAVAGLTIRMLMYPLVIKAQQNSARMSNIAPEMEKISKNMREANMSGQSMAAGMEMAKLQALLESNNISMARNFLPLAQAPVFISFFIALRQMANLPVESMKSGGMFWFSDLTVPDPYLLLPVMSVCTMLLVMEVGAEGGVNVERLRKMKWVFRGMAVITFPIMVKMPVALFMYWMTSNMFALSTALLLRYPPIRQAVGIPKLVPRSPDQEIPKTGFVDGLKESYKTAQAQAVLRQQEQLKRDLLTKAGKAKIPTTHKYKPKKR